MDVTSVLHTSSLRLSSCSLSPHPHTPCCACQDYLPNLSPSRFKTATGPHVMSSATDLEYGQSAQAAPRAGAFCCPSHHYPVGQRCLWIARKGLEETIQHRQFARISRLSHKLRRWMRHLLPLAVVSRTEYFVLLPRCAAEATTTTLSATAVISQYKQDKVRVRQRYRFVRFPHDCGYIIGLTDQRHLRTLI